MAGRKNHHVDSSGGNRKIDIEHPECNINFLDRKAVLSKKTEKTYKVTLTYVTVSDEEAKIKRAIIESILKKGCI